MEFAVEARKLLDHFPRRQRWLTPTMLKIDNLHARIGDTDILKGLSLELGAGEVHAIMGPTAPERAPSPAFSPDARNTK